MHGLSWSILWFYLLSFYFTKVGTLYILLMQTSTFHNCSHTSNNKKKKFLGKRFWLSSLNTDTTF